MGVSYYTCDSCGEAYPEHWSGGECVNGHSYCEGCSEDLLYELDESFRRDNPEADEEAVEDYMGDIKWSIPEIHCEVCTTERIAKDLRNQKIERILKSFDEAMLGFRKQLEKELD